MGNNGLIDPEQSPTMQTKGLDSSQSLEMSFEGVVCIDSATTS